MDISGQQPSKRAHTEQAEDKKNLEVPTMSIVVHLSNNRILEYNPTTGTATYYEPLLGGTRNVKWTANGWANDWTHMVSYDYQGQPYLLSYKSGDGTACFNSISDHGLGSDTRQAWRTGWQSFTVYYEAGSPRLLSLRPGEASVDSLTANAFHHLAKAY